MSAIANKEEAAAGPSAAAVEAEAEAGAEDVVEVSNQADVVSVSIDLPSGLRIELPLPIFIGETFATVRQSLSDFQESAHYTNFHLRLAEMRSIGGEVVEIANDSDATYCYDYLEINSCFAAVSDPEAAADVLGIIGSLLLRLVPDQYDVKKVLLQLRRTNEIIKNPPMLRAQMGASTSSSGAAAAAVAAKDAKAQGQQKDPESDSLLPPVTRLLMPVSLGAFYDELLLRPGSLDPAALSKEEEARGALAAAVRSVFASGWNPPDARRRFRGDLLYIEAALANERTIHLTATPRYRYLPPPPHHTQRNISCCYPAATPVLPHLTVIDIYLVL